MPGLTSNGQITDKDIRQLAVRERHIRPGDVATDKLADLAVTDVKNNTLIDFDGQRGSASNVSLSTTETQWVEVDVDIPAWANIALWLVDTSIQVSTAGSQLTMIYRVVIGDDGTASGTGSVATLPANATQSIHPQESVLQSVTPGSTVTVGLWTWLSSGTNSSNQLAVRPGVIFAR